MVRNVVEINGEKVLLKDLSQKEQQRLSDLWNRKAAAVVNYIEVKTA